MSKKIPSEFKIRIEVSDPKSMRYPTVGDWQKRDNKMIVEVADTGNADYNFLIALHELVEVYLCHRAGITEKEVNDYDFNHDHCDDPGSHTDAPYNFAHEIANDIESSMSIPLLVSYPEYEAKQDKIYKQIKKLKKGVVKNHTK